MQQAELFHIPPKRRLTFIGLHGVISQKTEAFRIYIVKRGNSDSDTLICSYDLSVVNKSNIQLKPFR
jgi:hypothetical protein